MKAVVFEQYGPPEVLHVAEVPMPRPDAGEVLIRVCASTVSSGDLRLRKADPFFLRSRSGWLSPSKIRILGMEVSGTVVECGAKVEGFTEGEEVFGSTGLKFGGYAEFACVAVSPLLAKRPANLRLEEAAAISYGASSSLHFLRAAQVTKGSRVLIYGASGNVGTFAVQLAKHFGAYVTAVCGPANLEFVKELGADSVLDYTKADFGEEPACYDVIFDTVGKSQPWRILHSLKRGGAFAFSAIGLAPYLALGFLEKLSGRAKVVGGIARTRRGDLDFLQGLIEQGAIRPVIDNTFEIRDVVHAHGYAETGHKRGSVILRARGW